MEAGTQRLLLLTYDWLWFATIWTPCATVWCGLATLALPYVGALFSQAADLLTCLCVCEVVTALSGATVSKCVCWLM